MTPPTPLRQRDILRFWLPLASTWLMMACEGPFLAALIARLPDPRYNLAAHGVAFAMAIIIEAPVIMMLGAATALVDGRNSYIRLRRFTMILNVLMTLGMLVLVATPVYELVLQEWIGLDERVAALTRGAMAILVPWPAAIVVAGIADEGREGSDQERDFVAKFLALPQLPHGDRVPEV